MRRSEFEVNDLAAKEAVLSECEYGVLSLISEGVPYGVAVNFAYRDGLVYFHGSREGRKAEAIAGGTEASFLVVKPYAFIPSYFSDTRSAAPATQFFASLHLQGRVTPVTDAAQKAEGLTALMQKMQPEGGYEAIDPANPIYAKILEQTAVFTLHSELMTLKVKAGQNLSTDRRKALIEKLQAREGEADRDTIDALKIHAPKADRDL